MTLTLRGERLASGKGGAKGSDSPIDALPANLAVARPVATMSSLEPEQLPDADDEDFPPSDAGGAGEEVVSPDPAGYVKQATQTRMEHVQAASMNQYISGLQAEAMEAIHEREVWKEHVRRCAEEELKDKLWRKALAKDYGQQLLRQMQQTEERRQEGRRMIVDQVSTHGFPDFRRAPERVFYDSARKRQDMYSQDLDHQVDTKERLKHAARQRELEWEIAHVQAVHAEQDAEKKTLVEKEVEKRAALREAWEHAKRLQTVKRAIEEQRDGKDTLAATEEQKQAMMTKIDGLA